MKGSKDEDINKMNIIIKQYWHLKIALVNGGGFEKNH